MADLKIPQDAADNAVLPGQEQEDVQATNQSADILLNAGNQAGITLLTTSSFKSMN